MTPSQSSLGQGVPPRSICSFLMSRVDVRRGWSLSTINARNRSIGVNPSVCRSKLGARFAPRQIDDRCGLPNRAIQCNGPKEDYPRRTSDGTKETKMGGVNDDVPTGREGSSTQDEQANMSKGGERRINWDKTEGRMTHRESAHR